MTIDRSERANGKSDTSGYGGVVGGGGGVMDTSQILFVLTPTLLLRCDRQQLWLMYMLVIGRLRKTIRVSTFKGGSM